jgi:ribonuclease HI
MELVAVLMMLQSLKAPCNIDLYTDSKLVIGWVFGWDTVQNKPDPDKRFICKKPFLQEIAIDIRTHISKHGHHIEWHHVKGHQGNPDNELVDREAAWARANRKGVDIRGKTSTAKTI